MGRITPPQLSQARASGAFAPVPEGTPEVGQVPVVTDDSPLTLGWGDVAAGGATLIRKTADETVNNSTTLQADDHLTVAVEASSTYLIRVNVLYGGVTSTVDFKAAFSGPTGATAVVYDQRMPTSLAGGPGTLVAGNDAGAGPNGLGSLMACATLSQAAGTTRRCTAQFLVILRTDTTPGTFALEWAQNTMEAVDVTVYADSFLTYQKVA